MFFMVEIRLNIVFATLIASQFAKNPGYQHTKRLKTILQYFKSFKKRGITYGGQKKLLVEEYLDLDQANNKKSQKSTSGFIFMLNEGSVS